MAFIMEQAGGAGSTGHGRILDVKPTQIHERVPAFLGSVENVYELEQFFTYYSDDDESWRISKLNHFAAFKIVPTHSKVSLRLQSILLGALTKKQRTTVQPTCRWLSSPGSPTTLIDCLACTTKAILVIQVIPLRNISPYFSHSAVRNRIVIAQLPSSEWIILVAMDYIQARSSEGCLLKDGVYQS
jgi:hypothetical protein